MKYLIYMSTSSRLFNDNDLTLLLRKSQANNKENSLTGMLLYSDGTFVQVLEGHILELEKTYEKIQKDKRHKNIIKLAEGSLDERIFPTWVMGFKVVSPDVIAKFDAYINPKKDDVLPIDDTHPAITILRTFADTNKF